MEYITPIETMPVATPTPVVNTNNSKRGMMIAGLIALILFLLLWVYYVSQQNMPSQDYSVMTPTGTTTVTATLTPTPTSTITATPTPTVTPKPDQNVKTSNPNVMQYTSDDLGITFKYTVKDAPGSDPITATRVGNKVSVGGQSVEVFTKDPAVTMSSDMQTRFLTGYSSKNCFLASYSVTLPAGYEAKMISLPATTDLEDMDNKLKLCPAAYTTSNGVAYFEGSNVRNDKYAFLSIGQDAIAGDKSDNTWQDTLRFVAK